MRIFNQVVLDETMYGTAEYITPDELAPLFGSAEKYMVQIRAAHASGTTRTLSIKLYSSSDGGQNWVNQYTVGSTTLSSAGITHAMLQDAGTAIHGALVRFGFSMSNSDNVADVKIIICGRGEQIS